MILAILSDLHASPSILAMGFSVLLVLSLVAVEELELRRAATPAEGARMP